MASTRNYLTVAFLPWLDTQQEIIVGDYSFWPFRKLAEQKISDAAIREHLNRIFDTYVETEKIPGDKAHIRPVAELTIVTCGNADFSHEPEFESDRRTRDVLAFACLDKNPGFNWCTGDNFEIIYHNFRPGVLDFGYTAGGIAPITSMGWYLGELHFPRPLHVNRHYNAKHDEDLLRALSFALKNNQRPACLAIVRSLDYFRQTYSNSTDVGRESRILLMALAFEVLLDLENRKDLRDKIHVLCGDPSEPTQQYQIVNTKTGAVMATEALTTKQIWAEEFYKLRDKIVHGHEVTPAEFLFNGEPHFRIGVLFFRICVRKQLEALGDSGYKCFDSIIIDNQNGFEFHPGLFEKAWYDAELKGKLPKELTGP